MPRGTKTKEPILPQVRGKELRPVSPVALRDDDLLEEFSLKGIDVTGGIARDVRFLVGRIERSRFDQTKFIQGKLVDVVIENSHFSNADWGKTNFERVSIGNSKLTGFRAIESRWKEIIVKESKADLSLFILAKFKNVTFEDCIFSDADFQECEMENVRFYKCDLTSASFLGAKLKNVDFRGSKIEKIGINPEQFRGITIEPLQASYLIGTTGAKVMWLDDEEPNRS
jgi:uncharacterized protein YjbI with pentapeptide repeats